MENSWKLRLKDKTAIVTGASRGIGRAIAIRLAGEGAQVVLCARDGNLMEHAVREIERGGGRAAALGVDLREMDAAKQTADFTLQTYGRIDIVVNNAGATKRGDFLELTDEDWADGFALKFFGAMRLTRAAWPHLKAQAGSVLNISGVGGRMPGALFTIGGSVNAAVLSFTKAMADVGIRDGVQVNAVNPGSIRTERYRRMLEADCKARRNQCGDRRTQNDRERAHYPHRRARRHCSSGCIYREPRRTVPARIADRYGWRRDQSNLTCP